MLLLFSRVFYGFRMIFDMFGHAMMCFLKVFGASPRFHHAYAEMPPSIRLLRTPKKIAENHGKSMENPGFPFFLDRFPHFSHTSW